MRIAIVAVTASWLAIFIGASSSVATAFSFVDTNHRQFGGIGTSRRFGVTTAGTTSCTPSSLSTSSAFSSSPWPSRRSASRLVLALFPISDNKEEYDEDDDDDDDDPIDADSLGDWRTFRRNLAAAGMTSNKASPSLGGAENDTSSRNNAGSVATGRSIENEQVLRSQNELLANEYKTGAWAHTTATPEVGGIVCRLPLEVEICRNYKHSLIGKKLRRTSPALVQMDDENNKTDNAADSSSSSSTSLSMTREWYKSAKSLVDREMQDIAESAEGGQIDASTLSDEAAELLQLYIDNQEFWQEVCLVLERDTGRGTCTTIILNRPIALKLTENLARLVLNGAFSSSSSFNRDEKTTLSKFMSAFGPECAVYSGGSDGQQEPATLLHGIADLPGAVEISPNTGIYRGGLASAVDGVLDGRYKPLDFRFFVGRHDYQESMLDVKVLLGKYQPIACARSLALKQCLSLPKPLWHEALELCGGELKEISTLEMLKRDDLSFEIVDEDDDDDGLNHGLDIEVFDDDDDDEEFYA